MLKRCLLSVAILFGVQTSLLSAEHTTDSLDKVRENLANNKAVLIDVREPGEWKRGHLQDATLVPLSALKQVDSDAGVKGKVEKTLPKDRIVYCHCASGRRVLVAADILGKMGYDVRPLSSGFDALRGAGFPEAKSE